MCGARLVNLQAYPTHLLRQGHPAGIGCGRSEGGGIDTGREGRREGQRGGRDEREGGTKREGREGGVETRGKVREGKDDKEVTRREG